MQNKPSINWYSLIPAAIARDKAAVTEIIALITPLIKNICENYSQTIEDTEDLVQESLIRIFDNLDTLQDPQAFIKWAQVICTRVCLSFARKKNPYLLLNDMILSDENEEKTDPYEYIASTDQQLIPDQNLNVKESVHVLRSMINNLPEEQKFVITQYYLCNMKVNDIAEICNVSSNTIKSRLKYGRSKLVSNVEEYQKRTGVKLFNVAPISVLSYITYVLRQNSSNSTPKMSPAALTKTVLKTVDKTSSKAMAGGASMVVAKSMAVKGAASAVGKGISTTIGAKIVMGIISAVAVTGAVLGGATLIRNNINNIRSANTVNETSSMQEAIENSITQEDEEIVKIISATEDNNATSITEEKVTEILEETSSPLVIEDDVSLGFSFETGLPSNVEKINVSMATASSEIVGNGYYYPATNAVDGKTSTNWQENDTTGPGIGQWIQVNLAQHSEVAVMALYLGYGTDADRGGVGYYQNSRPKSMTLSFDDREFIDITFNDLNGWQYIWLDYPVETSFIKFTINTAYAGSEWQDTAITEIELYKLSDNLSSTSGEASNSTQSNAESSFFGPQIGTFTSELISVDPSTGEVVVKFHNESWYFLWIGLDPYVGDIPGDLVINTGNDQPVPLGEDVYITYHLSPILFTASNKIDLCFDVHTSDGTDEWTNVGSITVWEPAPISLSSMDPEILYADTRAMFDDYVQMIQHGENIRNDERFAEDHWIYLWEIVMYNSDISYGYTDLDLDGIPEMLVFCDNDPYVIYAMFSFLNSEVQLVLTSANRARFGCNANGYLFMRGSSSAFDNVELNYILSNGQLAMQENIYTREDDVISVREFCDRY